MEKETIEIIQVLIQERIDSFIPTERYLTHQLALRAKERIIEEDDETIKRQLSTIRLNLTKLNKAKEDFETFLIMYLKDEGK